MSRAWINHQTMSKFKVKLDTRRQLQDGTYPLIIRIHSGTKRRDINLKTYLKESEFDASTQRVNSIHPNKKLINQKIQKQLLQLQAAALNIEIKEETVTASKIKTSIVKPILKLNFIQFGNKLIAEMEAVKRIGNAIAYRDALTALQTYSGKTELQFTDINYELLCQIENKMLIKGRGKNSVATYNRRWRAIFNRAINEDLIDSKLYPYRKYKIKGEGTAKRNIAKEDIIGIAKLDLEQDSQLFHARNYFMLSFNLRGMSFADMAGIKPSDIINGRLIYQRKKTHKLYNVKLTEKAQEILNYYQRPNRTFILPVLEDYMADNPRKQMVTIQQAIKVCNKYLNKIGEELKLPLTLTTYVARHSHSTIAKKMGYSKDMIAESLGHSIGSAITDTYLGNYDLEVIDAMNEAVCKF